MRRLAEVIGKYIDLEWKGGVLVGLCCFCDGPLVVEGKRWDCQGCGEGGDASTFLRLLLQKVRTTKRDRELT